MPKIKILAVEDDALHADILRMEMDNLGYDLIDICDNGAEMLRLIKATHPDLILMDIDIGGEITGIELVKEINQQVDIPVIFLTSYKDESTFKLARETLPEAYITKPFDPVQLKSAIELAIFKKQQELLHLKKQQPANQISDSFFVKEGDALIKLLLKDILLIEAYDKYCLVYTREKKHLLSVQFKSLTENLPRPCFVQVHRSYIINLEALEKIRLGQNSIEIAGKVVPISKTYKNQLFTQIKIL